MYIIKKERVLNTVDILKHKKIMIKHIVFWRLKDTALGNTKQENAKKMKKMLTDLADIVDGLIKVEVGLNFNPNGYDISLYTELESIEALNFYQTHPDHLIVKDFVKEVVTERAVVDYLMD